MIMDELTIEIQDEVPWYMLFADDLVLINEFKEGVNNKLEQWRHTLEFISFKLRRSKTEYLRCCFSGGEESGVEVTTNGMTIPRVEKFKYLRTYKKKGRLTKTSTNELEWDGKNG